jgi:single-stranded-DNA-specific exonuclease
LVQLLGLECGLPTAVAGVLVNRGLRTADEAQRFLQPDLLNLHDGLRMRDLGRAAERILAAIARGERIFIQGDYDVDGITSTFLLYSVLERLGASPEYRIPDRITEGYGLSLAAVEDARQRGCTLIITVDCGITAVEPVAHANATSV